MKNKVVMLVLFFIITLSLVGCSGGGEKTTELSMLSGGKTFAVPTGTIADQFVMAKFPDAKIKYFNSALDCAIAVKSEKADAAVYDKPILKNIAAKNEGLIVLPELLFDDNYGFAVALQNKELKTVIDTVVAELKVNGTYEDMMRRWFPEKGNPGAMSEIKLTGNKGVLRFGTAAVTEPLSFMDDSRKIVGFDIELAAYIAKKLDMQLEIVDMDFGAMIPALIAGKVDMIGAGISITEERAKKVLFSESYYAGGIAVAVRSDTKTAVKNESTKLKTVDDIKDKRIGVLLGSVYDTYSMKNFPKATILQYKSPSDIILAVKSGKVDAAFYSYETLLEILQSDKEFGVLDKSVFSVPIGMGFNKENDSLREKFNVFLQQTKENGLFDDMVNRWILNGVTDMPVIENPKTNGVLTVGMVSDKGLPFTIVKDNKMIGFDVELVERFAAYLGKELKLVDMEFGSLIAAVSTNKVDIIASTLMITEERKQKIDFSDPYYKLNASVFALKKNIESTNTSELTKLGEQSDTPVAIPFLKNLSDSFYSNIILENRYLLLVDGLKTTALIALISTLFGTLLGAFICFMRMSKNKLLITIAKLYISIMRGTPVLVLLMIVYYVVFASVNINPLIAAVFAFGTNFAAYVSEMFRTSIESIDKGQKEAGIAGGFTKIQTFIYIIIPQALRQVLPVYKGEFISLVKMTSIVGYIAVQDLTKASDIIRSRTFDAFFPLIMVAVLYFFVSWSLALALDYIGVKSDPKRNRKMR